MLIFGSLSTELYLPGADIDLVLLHDTYSEKNLMNKAKNVFKRNSDIIKDIEVLQNAKVPIIKFIHKPSNIEFDITFNEQMGLDNIKEVKKAISIHPEIKYLTFVMKMFLRQRRLNVTFNGGIGSFLLFNMILAFLRTFKKNIVSKTKDIHSLTEITLSEYLLKLLQFYASFDVFRNEIHMSKGGRLEKKISNNGEFCLYSPIEPSHNIGGKSFKIREIFNVFKNRLSHLTNTKFEGEGSILMHLINPSGKNFETYLYD